MRRLLTGYAIKYNHRHKRHGQFFQDRYKSIICQEDIYLKELVRYILGGWAAAKKLRLKGQNRVKGDERILGDIDFVMNILSEANERMDRHYELRSLGYDIDKLEQRILEIYQIERQDLYFIDKSF
jgi:hypothetical protein